MDQFNPPSKEEARAWLEEFMRKVNSQDNRATASPHFYVIHYKLDEVDRVHKENIFFTEDAAEAYLEANRHNLPNGYVYLDHARRNPEIRNLLLSLGVLLDQPYNWR
jgi:hypothetical protein